MNQKQQNIPALRFTQFNEEWNKTSLGDIATFSKGKGISKSDISEDGLIECVRYGELYTEYDEIIEEIVSKTNLDKKGLVFSEYNDVIIPSSGETQLDIATASCVLKSDVALGGDLNIIKTPYNGVFLAFYLNNKKKKDIARFAQGNSVVHLYSKQLALLKLKLPTIPEQQKIATFLTMVDKRIQALERKKELLEQYKKGVMQKIFNREIRFQPGNVAHHLHLAAEPETPYNGNDRYPDWEVKKLAKVCKLQGGYPFKSSSFKNSGIPVVRISNISNTNNNIEERGIVFYDELNNDQSFTLKKGDLLIAMSGATTGKSSVYDLDIKGYLNQRVGVFRLLNNEIYYPFLIQFVFSRDFEKQLSEFLVAGAQPNISSFDIEKIKISLPCLEEQQKIAGFLSAIDTKIEAVTSQIDHSKTFKKGLLQKMFV